jgi:hypothetical protein
MFLGKKFGQIGKKKFQALDSPTLKKLHGQLEVHPGQGGVDMTIGQCCLCSSCSSSHSGLLLFSSCYYSSLYYYYSFPIALILFLLLLLLLFSHGLALFLG